MCKTRNLDKAKDLLYSFPLKGVSPDTRTYTIMIKGLFRAGMTTEAQDLFTKMGVDGVDPDDFTFNIMVQGFLAEKNDMYNTMAMEVINTMKERGFSMNAETMSMLVDLLEDDGLDSKWMKMLSIILPKGYKKGNGYACVTYF
ncbi:hypothetical protein ACHQM5_014500 [Ranunculus cassubicifolius]